MISDLASEKSGVVETYTMACCIVKSVTKLQVILTDVYEGVMTSLLHVICVIGTSSSL
jgi:hypothetical protein